MTKPFAFSELLVRAEKLMLRGQSQPAKTDLKVGLLEMELLTRKVTLDGTELMLQPKEFQLLKYLMEHANQVISAPCCLKPYGTTTLIPEPMLLMCISPS